MNNKIITIPGKLGFSIGTAGKCLVVAEAGSNHNGDLQLGKKLIEAAKECGCDAVKFQAFKADKLVTKKAVKAEYQRNKSKGASQLEMLKSLELTEKDHRALIEHANRVKIAIFYSVFDQESADLIESMGVNIFKLGSGEITNIPFIRHIALKNKPCIFSTGMADEEEISACVNSFRKEGNCQIVLMNCSTGYPSKLENSHLRRMKYLEGKFNIFCGNSDHTEGITVSAAAAALGAPMIEKHFTIDKNLPGSDHSMSMDKAQMKELIRLVRIVEKKPVGEHDLLNALNRAGVPVASQEIKVILGNPRRTISEEEASQRLWARKSVVASRDIKKGEVFNSNNTGVKRPEAGISPYDYEKVIGKKAKCLIKEGNHLTWDVIE
ncbi:MAG: N-acetylneuraminate synthase family protein [Candidatus Omnitrophota bacterium]